MKNYITDRQISFMLYTIMVGYGVINLPKNTAEAGGTGGWVSIILVTLLFSFIAYIITYLQRVHEGKTIYEYSKQLVGKFITYIFIFIFITYFLIYFTFLVKIYCYTISLVILNKTPVIYLSIFFYIITGYAVFKGINTISKVCEIYGFLSIFFSIIFGFIIFTQGRLVNVTPFFVAEDVGIYLKGITKIFLPFIGVELLTLIPIYKDNNRKVLKSVVLAIGFIGILYIYLVEAVLSVVGVETIVYIKASVLEIAKGLDITYLEVFRRLDGIYIFAWTLNIICASSLWCYGATTLTSKLFKIRYNISIILIIILSFIISQVPRTMEQVEKILIYTAYFGILVFFIIPFTLFLITKVKRYDKKT